MTWDLVLFIVLFIVGLVLIIKGGDFFVDAASWIAEVANIPKLIIGATIVSLATTLPEMIVSIMAATNGSVDISVGNAIGSVTANIGLIMAISVLFMPGKVERKDILLKSILMLGGAAIIVVCGFIGYVSIPLSVLLICIFIVFMYENIHNAVKHMKEEPNENDVPKDKKTVFINIIKFIIGVAGIVVGANFLVWYGKNIAWALGISERIIGVTIVAVGTSLPELITTLTAIKKKESSLSIGNVIGANIIDLTLILPLCSLVSGQALPIGNNEASIKMAQTLDLPVCLLVGSIALIPTLINKKFSRWQGITLLVVYATYVVLTCVL